MYAYLWEHFELLNYMGRLTVTCLCGQDFLWHDLVEQAACPNCNEAWSLKVKDNKVCLTRVSTGSMAMLPLGDDGTLLGKNAGVHDEFKEIYEASLWPEEDGGYFVLIACRCGHRFFGSPGVCPRCGLEWKIRKEGEMLVVECRDKKDRAFLRQLLFSGV